MHQKQHMYYKNKWFLFAAGVLFLLCIDQFSKLYMQRELAGFRTISIIDNVLELRYLENTGASFGILKGKIDLILIATIALIAYLLWEYAKMPIHKSNALFAISCCMCVAGGIGNMIDRMLYGYVIDFIYVKLIDFPIFNLADCFIVLSVGMLMYISVRDVRRQKEEGK